METRQANISRGFFSAPNLRPRTLNTEETDRTRMSPSKLRTLFRHWVVVILLLGSVSGSLKAEVEQPTTHNLRPDQIGLSSTGLDRITEMLESEVQQGNIAGAVAAISRHGKLGYFTAVGQRDVAANVPMEADTIFRIASMTKAITSAGILLLKEEGQLDLDDPVSKFLPRFASQRVLEHLEADTISTVAASSVPTIRQLLTHTSGLTYGWFGPKGLDAIYRQQTINDFLTPTSDTIAERVNRIAQVPLKFQPGSNWNYGVSTDVLGRVIEVTSGLTLDQFFRERFFRPLRMNDTHFYLPETKQERLSSLYTLDDQGSLIPVSGEPVTSGFLTFSDDYCLGSQRRFYSGGAGLISTTSDYLRFLQMLLNGGDLEGVRVLRRKSVAEMTKNQIGDLKVPFGGHGDGFGLGFGVVTDQGASSDHASVGSFSWGGIFNTYFWVDPQEQLIGLLMTQLFPYDHLTLRNDFKQLTYQALDDSGFRRIYWYEKGAEHANPHFNGRQLRVNAPEVSVHPTFAARSEPRSSGMARIQIDEELRSIRRADLYTEIWGGHPGTTDKRVSVNGRTMFALPDVGTTNNHCTHQYPSFNLRPIDLVNGHNSLQFACDQGDTFWGHYIVDNTALQIGLTKDDERLGRAKLTDFNVMVEATPVKDGEGYVLEVKGTPAALAAIAAVDYQGKYFGFDENGNTWRTDWHGMTKERQPYGMLGSSREKPFRVVWDTTLLPEQTNVSVRAFVHFKAAPEVVYHTTSVGGLVIEKPEAEQVTLHASHDLPAKFWSRADQRKECTINLDIDPRDIVAAELHVVTWTGGAGEVTDYFTLNGQHFPVAEGSDHSLVYSRLPVDKSLLQRGSNKIVLRSDTTHHGIEVMLPGPTLAVRHRKPGKVRLHLSAVDESAGNLDCYKIETPTATYYLEKVGAGLSSLIDRDGNDWLGFHPKPGSGAGGEYRGFPNAVFREAGSYFHPRNAGTDPCVTTVEEEHPQRVVISAWSHNGKWAGRYEFTPHACIFTMTKMPRDHKYWVLYEGTPGGQYNDDDWWMTSAKPERQSLLANHEGDILGPEWIAFGDKKLNRVLFLSQLNDDPHPDRFYQMQKKMTVFGFGREGMTKFLDSVPRSFAIGLVESTDHDEVGREVVAITTRKLELNRQPSSNHDSSTETFRRRAIEQFALTAEGNSSTGKQLFFNDERTKCSTCHRVHEKGGQVGPDLSKIGGKFDRPHLIESLIHPSQQIVEGYRTLLVVTEEGQVINGVRHEQDDESVTVIDANSQRHKIDLNSIDEQVEVAVSLMPEGLPDLLSPQEFTDLIAYLETLRTGKAKFGSGVSGPIEIPRDFEIDTVTTGLTGATALETLSDGRILVCEQPGQLRVVKDGKLLPTPMLTLTVDNNWERGLIGVTTAPDFPADPHLYVVYVAKDPYPHHRISRFVVVGDVAISDSEEILLRGDDQTKMGGNVPAGHQGGAIHFGNDGKIYIGIGEQTAGAPAQKLDTFLGKLLRLNPDGSIPNDNPFLDVTSGKYQAIWARGCRNPFTFSVQRSTGTIFINDVGGKHEEVNRGVAGANYGWPVVEHGPTTREGFVGAIHYYPEASIAGGDFAELDLPWPEEYLGRYFFADFVHGWIRTLDPGSPGEATDFAAGLRRPVDLRFANDGSLYVLLRNAWVIDQKFTGSTGALLRIRPKSVRR